MFDPPEWQSPEDEWDSWRALSAVLGAVGGVVLGGYIAFATAGDPYGFEDEAYAAPGRILLGGLLGFMIGLLVGLFICSASARVWERLHGRT